ncbi:amidohydrolase [Marivirga sp. S37H4]|uniref:Amidohydrolase n=1 Tax=Marivirga aurantiaca TaxID=2802615 RepID=A0A934WZJ5_9BACT|nr:amidohydrolase [Marivirga aurantiaca]MBK6266108.1 amidohydrolase [Marivirga aurantiaca]
MRNNLLLLLLLVLSFSCSQKEEVDYLFYNGKVYQANEEFKVTGAFAIKNSRFVAVGNDQDILNHYESAHTIDLAKAPVYPGFIDGHAHFYRYSLGLRDVDLGGTKSFNEIIERLQKHAEEYPEEEWLLGRGWDQNDWDNNEFPDRDTLDLLFPNKVIMLTRVDGHAVLTNKKGLDLAGINAQSRIPGGEIILKNGKASGVLIDNAIYALSKEMPEIPLERKKELLLKGQANCFEVGITSLADAGLDKDQIELMSTMQKERSLKMRTYAMINPSEENMNYYFGQGHIKTDQMHVRSFKIYGDGALGSRGACLVEPYTDMPTTNGFLLSDIGRFDSLAKIILAKDFQMNTHCIGDSANRVITGIYGKYLKGKNDKRWRIEHAQVVKRSDISKFGLYNILPSVQPTHATSDMYWAEERLGKERIETAYAYQELLKQNGKLILGSDFPVEDINPLFGFHAAVARQDGNNYPDGGFQSENALSREEALKGMTLWAAYGQFEEAEKGSIEKGKFADFVILDQDIMEVEPGRMRRTQVMQTWIGGEKVYSAE